VGQQTPQENLVHTAAKSLFAIDDDYGNAVRISTRQFLVLVDIHDLGGYCVPCQNLPSPFTLRATLPCVENNLPDSHATPPSLDSRRRKDACGSKRSGIHLPFTKQVAPIRLAGIFTETRFAKRSESWYPPGIRATLEVTPQPLPLGLVGGVHRRWERRKCPAKCTSGDRKYHSRRPTAECAAARSRGSSSA
jgi:hypothetical protein